jgi:hypothetical protein
VVSAADPLRSLISDIITLIDGSREVCLEMNAERIRMEVKIVA